MAQLSYPCMTTGKTTALTRQTFVSKVMSLLFNMLSKFVIAFKKQTSSNFMAAVTIHSNSGAQEEYICHCFHFFAFYLPWSDETRCHDLVCLMLSFRRAFSISSFTLIKRFFSSSSLSVISGIICLWGCWYFSQQSWFQLVTHPARQFSWFTLHIN